MNTTERNAIATMDHHAKLANLPTWSELKAKVDAGNGKTPPAKPAPLDLTKPVRTHDGRAVRILCTDAAADHPVVALLKRKDGTEYTAEYTADGFLRLDRAPTDADLVNVKTEPKSTCELYANLYPEKLGVLSVDSHYIKRIRGADSTGTIKLTLFDDGNVTVEKVEV